MFAVSARRVLLIVTPLILTALVIGCGGGDGDTPVGTTYADGSYVLTYTGSSGAVQFTVTGNNAIGYGIDSSGEKFPVSGTFNKSTGALNISGTGDQGHTYTFTGNISGSGTWSSTAGDSGSWEGERTGNVGNVSGYAGNWSGTYTGDFSGTWTASIDANGLITGKVDGVLDAVGVVTGSGSVRIGEVSVEGMFMGTFSGQFTASTGSGTWVGTDSDNGTWSGVKGG